MVIRQGKWDIPAYWGDGSMLGMHLAYVPIDNSVGPPDTIDRAYPFVKDKIVAFGFPDILFRPKDVFTKLLARLNRQGSDVVLALFRAHNTKEMDMIDIDANQRVRAMHLKPNETRLKYAWLCAVWTPTFTEFLHSFLHKVRSGAMANSSAIDKLILKETSLSERCCVRRFEPNSEWKVCRSRMARTLMWEHRVICSRR